MIDWIVPVKCRIHAADGRDIGFNASHEGERRDVAKRKRGLSRVSAAHEPFQLGRVFGAPPVKFIR